MTLKALYPDNMDTAQSEDSIETIVNASPETIIQLQPTTFQRFPILEALK